MFSWYWVFLGCFLRGGVTCVCVFKIEFVLERCDLKWKETSGLRGDPNQPASGEMHVLRYQAQVVVPKQNERLRFYSFYLMAFKI